MGTTAASHSHDPANNPPWWRLPIVWLVIGAPASAVVASLLTVAIAVMNPDPVLDTSGEQVKSKVEAPAMQARNHAATPAQAAPKP